MKTWKDLYDEVESVYDKLNIIMDAVVDCDDIDERVDLLITLSRLHTHAFVKMSQWYCEYPLKQIYLTVDLWMDAWSWIASHTALSLVVKYHGNDTAIKTLFTLTTA